MVKIKAEPWLNCADNLIYFFQGCSLYICMVTTAIGNYAVRTEKKSGEIITNIISEVNVTLPEV